MDANKELGDSFSGRLDISGLNVEGEIVLFAPPWVYLKNKEFENKAQLFAQCSYGILSTQ